MALSAILACLLAFVLWSRVPSAPLFLDTDHQTWQLLQTIPHNNSCFTQGFTFYNETLAIESCGLYGQSFIQLLEFPSLPSADGIAARDFVKGPSVVQSKALSPALFVEGITLANNELYALTWRELTLLVLDPLSLEIKRQLKYPLHGWGIAYRPSTKTFLATDGSSKLYHLKIQPTSVAIQQTVQVICQGRPISYLNELELIGDNLYSNVWQSNLIYRIDPDTGACLNVWDMSGLERGERADVLNGIATSFPQAGGKVRIWVTGKRWSMLHLIEVPIADM